MRLVGRQIQSHQCPQLHPPRVVHVEQADRGAADIIQTNNFVIRLPKMFMPTILPGIEQTYDRVGLRIDGGEVRALVAIASITREREVFVGVTATMLNRHNVLDVKANIGNQRLRNPAVLATVGSATPNPLTHRRIHGCARVPRRLRALALRMARRSITSTSSWYSLRSNSLSVPSLAPSASESMRRSASASNWKRRICSNADDDIDNSLACTTALRKRR